MYIPLNYFLQQVRFILRHIRFFVFLLQHQYPRLGFIQHVSFLPITRCCVVYYGNIILRRYYITAILYYGNSVVICTYLKMWQISISKQYKKIAMILCNNLHEKVE